MAFTRSADGIASKGKTKGKNLGDSDDRSIRWALSDHPADVKPVEDLVDLREPEPNPSEVGSCKSRVIGDAPEGAKCQSVLGRAHGARER